LILAVSSFPSEDAVPVDILTTCPGYFPGSESLVLGIFWISAMLVWITGGGAGAWGLWSSVFSWPESPPLTASPAMVVAEIRKKFRRVRKFG